MLDGKGKTEWGDFRVRHWKIRKGTFRGEKKPAKKSNLKGGFIHRGVYLLGE